FIHQLTSTNKFIPETSVRKGSGSVTSYPFSWVYTIRGYKAARSFVQMSDDEVTPAPIPEDQLDRGSQLLRFMFGDTSAGRNAVVKDSRQLGQLAVALSDPSKVRLLEAGKSLDEVIVMTKPLDE